MGLSKNLVQKKDCVDFLAPTLKTLNSLIKEIKVGLLN